MKTPSPDFTDTDPAPEVPAGMEQATAWDDPPSASGFRVKAVSSADETDATPLVEEGIAEADRELRLEDEAGEDGELNTGDTVPPATGILS